MIPTKFRFIWQSGFREEDFQKSTNQKQELPVAAMFVNFKDASYQVSEENNLKNQPIRNKSPVVAMFLNESGQNEQSLHRTFHRCFLSSFGSFGQAVSEEKIFLNRPIRNKNCLWRPCLLIDRDKMCNLQIGPSIDASYQVSVHLAEGFQRRRLKCEK